MRMMIDTDARTLAMAGPDGERVVELFSADGFDVLSELWLQVGWDQRYSYTFSWLGRPMIQLPDDVVRLQEVVWRLRPDIIVETGVAHGGSAVFLAGLCRLAGHGRVVAVDIDIRPHNRAAIEEHPLADLITLIEGSSTDPEVVEAVRRETAGAETVLVILDSDHSRAHVRAELDAYGDLVSPGSWIVATDGIMRSVADTPSGKPEWTDDNPARAAAEFVAANPGRFRIERPHPEWSEGRAGAISYWPDAWIRRLS